MSFSFEDQKNGKMSFLDVEISRENGKFLTKVYHKPTFSCFYTHFEIFSFYTKIWYALYLSAQMFYFMLRFVEIPLRTCDFKINFPKKWLSEVIYS